MPYEPHGRLVFEGVRGTVAAPRERWAIRVNLNPVIPAQSGAPTPAQLDALGTAFDTRLGAHTTNDTRLTSVKWAFIGPDGKYSSGPVLSSELDLAGSRLSEAHVDQIAIAVSLNTATRGPRGRGRFYLPGPGFAIGPGSLMSATDAQSLATSAAGFLSDINAGWPDNGTVCVASSFGLNSPVTSVRVGRVFDTIRSRRASLSEDYGADVAVS